MPGDYVTISAYFWVPIVGPLIGAALSSWLYDFAIRDILKARRPPEPGIEAGGRTAQRDIPPDA
jgi:glycerol uptake facilitator protein